MMGRRWFDYLASALIVLVCLIAAMWHGPWLAILALVPCLVWGMLARGWQPARMQWAVVQLGLVLPMVVCITTMIAFTLVERWPFFTAISALCVSAAGSAWLNWIRRRRRGAVMVGDGQAARMLLFLSTCAVLYGLTLYIDLNAVHEIRVSVLRGAVIERDPAHGRISARLWLKGAPAAQGIDRVEVDSRLFDRSSLGAIVCVRVNQGWLHLQWYEAEAC